MQSKFLRLGGIIIELVEFSTLSAGISPPLRPLNYTGLTHLSFRVANIEEMAEKLANLGGTIHRTTFTKETSDGRDGEIIFCSDVDGTRIELMAYHPDLDFA